MRDRRLAALLLVASVAACTGVKQAMRGYAAGQSDRVKEPPADAAKWSDAEWGAFYAVEGDFGTLTTDNLTSNAVPWKLIAVLSDVVPEAFFSSGARPFAVDRKAPLQRFGMVYGATLTGPKTIHQLDAYDDAPVGYVRGGVQRENPDLTLELAVTNCTMCHGGRGFDAEGKPTRDVYWGIPNHSLDFDRYIDAITQAVLDPRATDEALLGAMEKRFPKLSQAERETYRKYILPGFRKALRESLDRWGSLHPWKFGGPGFSHGVAIAHEAVTADKTTMKASDFPAAHTKIPNVYSVASKPFLLIDGSYVSVPVATQDERFLNFLVGFLPVLGASVERSIAEKPRLEKVRAFLKELPPPRWPGPLDAERAARGKTRFAASCARCHGDRGEDGVYRYQPQRIPLDVIGTDPTRSDAMTSALAKQWGDNALRDYLTVENTGAYMPPSLAGVWAQAPYFHNGSVPTLWHVLKPEERPAKFWVGGHMLDLKRVGVLGEPRDGAQDYPEGYLPWSEPRLFDSARPGNSNKGHERMVAGLTDDQRWDLIEYLKGL